MHWLYVMAIIGTPEYLNIRVHFQEILFIHINLKRLRTTKIYEYW